MKHFGCVLVVATVLGGCGGEPSPSPPPVATETPQAAADAAADLKRFQRQRAVEVLLGDRVDALAVAEALSIVRHAETPRIETTGQLADPFAGEVRERRTEVYAECGVELDFEAGELVAARRREAVELDFGLPGP